MWRALCLFFLSFQTTGQWSKSWLYSSSSDLTPSGKWKEPHYCWVRVEVQAPPNNRRWPHTVGRGPQYLPAGMGVPVPYLTFLDTTPVETGEEPLKCQVTALQGWKFGSPLSRDCHGWGEAIVPEVFGWSYCLKLFVLSCPFPGPLARESWLFLLYFFWGGGALCSLVFLGCQLGDVSSKYRIREAKRKPRVLITMSFLRSWSP